MHDENEHMEELYEEQAEKTKFEELTEDSSEAEDAPTFGNG